MAVQSPPYVLQNGSHSAALFRQAQSAIWQEGGPVQPNEMWVAAQSTPNMSVQIGPGRCVVQGSQVSAPSMLPSGTGIFTSQAMYNVLNDAPATVTISAADPTNPRIDVVYVAVQDSFYSGSNNQALLGVVTGTPAPSPSAPAAPANSEILATVAVAANASSITNGVITNKVSPATPIGQPVSVDTAAHLLSWSPLFAGTYGDVYGDGSNNGLWRWTGSGWGPVAGPCMPHFSFARTTAFNFTTSVATLTWDAAVVEGVLAGFTVASGVFTCTVPGVYFINAEVTSSAAITGNVQLQKNGTSIRTNNQVNSSSGNQSFVVAEAVRLAVGDTIQVVIQATATVAGVATATQTRVTFEMLHG